MITIHLPSYLTFQRWKLAQDFRAFRNGPWKSSKTKQAIASRKALKEWAYSFYGGIPLKPTAANLYNRACELIRFARAPIDYRDCHGLCGLEDAKWETREQAKKEATAYFRAWKETVNK